MNDTSDYNVPFTMDEFEMALKKAHGKSSGPNDIPYDFYKHMEKSSKKELLKSFNYYFDSGNFPPEWENSINIPLIKPGHVMITLLSYMPTHHLL